MNNRKQRTGVGSGGMERIAPGEMLNEEEQEQLISTLQTQDERLNLYLKVVLTLASVGLIVYFSYLQADPSEKTASYLSIILTGFPPLFLWTTTKERCESNLFQGGLVSLLILSLLPPFLMGSLVSIWTIPFLLHLTVALTIRDMYVTATGIQTLHSKKYHLKAV